MSTLQLKTPDKTFIDAQVSESDQFSKNVCVKFARTSDNDVYNLCELYLTPSQLNQLGRFLLKQADEISTAQSVRHNDIHKV